MVVREFRKLSGDDSIPKEIDSPSEIIARFKTLLQAGKLKSGSKLPSERDLAKMMGVSRPTLRQALKALHLLKILETKPRSGTYVTAKSSEILQEPLHFTLLLNDLSEAELMDTRQLLEVHLAGLAAENADKEELEAMQRALGGMIESMNKPNKWSHYEILFHESIAAAAKNAVMFSIMQMLAKLLHEHRGRTVKSLVDYSESFQVHYRIFEQIQKGDKSGAELAMKEHFEYLSARSTSKSEGVKPTKAS